MSDENPTTEGNRQKAIGNSDVAGSPAASSETRISTLVGDRLCIKCGYNLVGQPIFREEHYDLFIVRCPECATVASLQEYPLLGRWANRWAALLAGLLALIVFVLWMGSAAAIFGLSIGAAEMASERYSQVLYQHFTQMQVAGAPGRGTVTATGGPAGQMVIVNSANTNFTTWWQQQNSAMLLQNAGGALGGVDACVGLLWFWEAVVAVVLGVMWATILIARGRPGLLLWALMIMLGAGMLSMIPLTDWLSGPPRWMYQASRRQVGPVVLIVSLVWGGVCLAMGMMIGRPVARGLIRLMLPPRLRSSLALLWLTDGLQPPKVNA